MWSHTENFWENNAKQKWLFLAICFENLEVGAFPLLEVNQVVKVQEIPRQMSTNNMIRWTNLDNYDDIKRAAEDRLR